MNKSSRVFAWFRGTAKLPVAAVCMTALACGAGSANVSAATLFWDADGNDTLNVTDGTDLGGTGAWNTSSALWWPVPAGADTVWPNTNADTAIFSYAYPALGNPVLNTVTVSSGITANRLQFNRSGYTLTGGDITLAGASPTLFAQLGESATITSQILGADGLTMSGGGTIRLAAGNLYTGTTKISHGSLIITNESALGADSSAIVVTGSNPAIGNTNLRSFGGGSLVLDGTGGNITIARDLSLQGQGPIGDRSAALVSTGVNTLSGTVNMGVAAPGGTFFNTRVIAADGTLNFGGTLNVLGTAATTISNLGGVNQAGASFYNVTGVLAGTGTLEGSGGGTLFLDPSDSSGFSGTIRVSGSAASGQSVVRIDSPGVLGTRTSTTTSSVLDMNGGVLAVLMDSPSVLAGGSAANVYGRVGSTFFADHTPNSSVKDQTVTFGQFAFEENQTFTFNSRNGYGMTFGAAPVQGGNNNNTFNNNLQGGALLTFNGAFWSNTDNGAARTMTFGGNGNTTINGNIIATSVAFDHILTKTGTGTLTLLGTASTLDGAINVNGGTVAISDRRAVTNNSSNININGGTLSIIGNNASQANLTFAKVINLSGTTGAATILANQTGTSPGVIFSSDFTATGAGAKTLTLGGTNIGANTIDGAIVQNGTTNLTKIDAGRWVLGGVNTYTGTTTISQGTLQMKANAAASTIIADTSAIVFNATNVYAGGTLELIGQASVNNVETLGALTPTNGSGTVKLTPGSGGTASIVFASLGTVGGGGTVNIDAPTASDTVTFTTTSITNNIANAGLFYNGADFAFVPGAGSALRAPIYGTDTDFTTGATLTAARSNELTGDFTSGAALAIDSLKISGSQTLTLGGSLTIRTAAGTTASGGIIQTGGSGTITGAFSIGTNNAAALVINVNGGANSLDLNSTIFGTGGFTKVGAGTLRLGAANNQTGTISINEGTVRLTTGGRLGAASAALTIRQDGILELNGITPATTTGAFNNNGIVRNTSATTDVTFTVGGGNGTGTSSGIIEDGGVGKVSVVKLGTGAQSWLGLSTYTGTTTIDSTGIVTINNLQNGGSPSGIGASSNAAGNLIFTGASTTQAFGGLNYTGTTNDETDRLFTFGGTAASSGARIQSNGVNGATSTWTNTGALAFGTVDIAQGLVLGGASTGDNRFFPIIGDNGTGIVSVYKADAGVWYLEATNTYTGPTTIRGGALYVNTGTSLPTASNLVLDGGSIARTGAFTRTLGTGANQVQWTANAAGGFSAGGSPLTVDWGTGAVWGVGPFIGTGALLLNNSGVAKSDVDVISGFEITQGAASAFSATTTAGSATVNLTSGTTAGWAIGQEITGNANIPAGRTIATIVSATQFTLNSGTGVLAAAGVATTSLVGGYRQVNVGDFTSIGADFGTISGVITGAGSLAKEGAGILNLRGANTYTGQTLVRAGTLVVDTLGNSASPGASSVGDSTLGNTNTGAVLLGAGGTAGILEYVGLGEVSDRKIAFSGTTGGAQIHADGVGALILTNVVNDVGVGGAKTLNLRGTNAAGNMITSQLSDNGGVLNITVDGGAMWILTNGANNYTGTTTISAGALGIGDDAALGTGNVDLSNGSVFAYGADRTIANPVRLANNTGPGFMGDYSLTFSSTLQLLAGANNINTLFNNIVAGKSLTFGNVTANAITASRSWTFDGSGETIIGGNITTSTAFGVPLIKTGDGILQLNGTASNFNQASQNIDIDRGTLRLGANEVIPNFGAATPTTAADVAASTVIPVSSTAGLSVGQIFTGTGVAPGSVIVSIDSPTQFTASVASTISSGATLTFTASGGVILSPEVAGGDTATLDLNGKTETINGLTMNTDGAAIIDNTSATAASLTFGANDSAVSIGGGIGSYTIQNSGGGALSITKTGAATSVIPTGVNLTYTGTTAVTGGSLTIASPLAGSTGLSVLNSGSVLALTGGITTPSAITSVIVGDGATLSLLDGAGSKFTMLSNLQLGSSSGTMTTLNLNVGDITNPDMGNTDTFTLLTGGTLSLFAGNKITLNLTDAGLDGSSTYNLIDVVDGGLILGALGTADWILGATPGGFSSITLNKTDTLISITTGTLITGTSYWRGALGGGTDTTWNANANNWSTDKAGTTAAGSTPGSGTDVVFQWDAPSNAAVVTTLEQNFKINSLTFADATVVANTATSVTIDPGTIPTSRLEVAPQVATDGIKVLTTNATSAIISGSVKLGGAAASQTWEVTNAGSLLSIGSLFGERDVTKTGAGKVTLTTAADPTFNIGVTSDFTINAGTLEILNSSALGNPVNANLASVTVNSTGAFYFNNATTTTITTGVANPLTLGGGTLSVGRAAATAAVTHFYTGTINVSGDSFINMADVNGPAGNGANNITLSGVVSGAGSLTIDSNSGLSGGNQLNGTVTLSNASNSWTGDLLFNEGTVTLSNAASPSFTTNDVTYNAFGRLNIQGLNGATLTRTGTVTYAAGAIGELGVDNTGAVVNSDFLVDQSGLVTLGSGGTGGNVRVFLSDAFSKLNITGGVTLGGSSSISVGGDAAGVATISSVISDGGSGYGLAVNDDAGGWGTTDRTLRLTGLNTFTGNVSLDSGILEYDTVTGISGAASSLGQGTAILVTNSANLRFIGTSAQTTNRPITAAAGVLTLSANGTGVGTKIDYTGAIAIANTADGSNLILSGAAGSEGVISGGITETGDAADMTVNGGTWTHQTGTSRIGDVITVTGANTIFNLDSGLFQVRNDVVVTAGANLNLNATGVLSFNVATLSADASLRATTGGIITIGANNAVDPTQFDGLRIGTDATGLGTLVMNANQSVTEFIVGNRNLDRSGLVNGAGTLTVTGNFDVYNGTVSANLGSSGSGTLEKLSLNTVTLSGDNSGLAATGSTVVTEGTLILDYTTNNATKLRAASTLDMRGSNLILNGNASAATSQAVGAFNLATGGSSIITLNPGSGQDIALNLGAITRGNVAQDGTIRFVLPSGTQSATNGITTTSPNSTSGLLGIGATSVATAAYATVNDGTGTNFATASSGNIVALVSTPKNDVTTWTVGDHITDTTGGFAGTLDRANINSLRFDAASGSDLVVAQGGIFFINSGGILVTDNVGGTPSLTGGTLTSGVAELVITQDSSQTFEIGTDIRTNLAVTKTGAGTLLLTGNNVYTGVTEIQQGTLQVTGGSIGDLSVVTLSATRGSTFELLGDETIGRLQGGSRNQDQELGTVAVGSNTLTINEAANTTFAGKFTGTGNIIINGPGNLNANNISSGFTGVVTIDTATLQLSNLGQIDAATIRVRKGSQLVFDNNGSTISGTRVSDTATITLNSADGGFSGQANVRGLSIRNDTNGTRDETVGVVNLNTGASYVGMEATAAGADADIIANDIVRLNSSTLSVRGFNLGINDTRSNQFRIGDATNQTAFIASTANLVGGAGAAATKNISIVPWAIGENLTANLAANNMGNSLVTYLSGLGFRPLDFATEYNTYTASAVDTENIRESLAADLTGLSGKTINALVLNNVATPTVNVTGSGAGQTLAVTSGTMLFTVSGATTNTAYSTILGGFDNGITVGSTNEYVVQVVNPNSGTSLTTGGTTFGSTRVTVASTTGLAVGMPVFGAGIPVGATVASVTSATVFEMSLPSSLSTSSQTFQYTTSESLTAKIDSPLTSAADITKAGRGTLIFTAVNTAGGGANKTTINEGTLEIADLDNIGGNTGGLVFSGGTLRLGATLTDDISLRTITFLQGGATIDTNGVSLALANSVGSGNGGLTKVGAGNLTLNAAATYTGATNVLVGTLTVGANNATGAGGDLGIGAGATLDIGANSITAGLVQTFGISPTLTGTGTITASKGFFFGNTGDLAVAAVLAGSGDLFKNQANVLTLSGLSTYTGTTEVQAGTLSFDTIANVGGGASALGAPTTVEAGVIRMGLTTTATTLTYTGAGSVSNRVVEMQGTTGGVTINGNGAGALVLGGVQTSMAGAKTLTLSGTSASGINNTLGSIDESVSTLTVNKTLANTWVLNGTNTYTGNTTVTAGTLQFAKQSALYNNVEANWVPTKISVLSGATAAFNVGGTGEFTAANVTTLLTNLSTVNNNGLRSGSTIGFDTTNAAGGTFTVADTIANSTGTGGGAVGVAKLGTNTLVLTGASTYTGATTVSGGTLQVGDGSTGSLTGAGTVTVSGTGTRLSGSGSIAGSTILGSGTVLAPGVGSDTSIDNRQLEFKAASATAVTVDSGAQIQLGITTEVFNSAAFVVAFGGGTDALSYLTGIGAGELTSWNAVPGAGTADFINLTGAGSNLSIGTGAGTISVLDNGYLASTPMQGDVFNLIDWTQVGVLGGTFNPGTDFSLPTLDVGLNWDFSAFTTYGVIVVVPEPSRALLLLFGLLGLMLRRRRKDS